MSRRPPAPPVRIADRAPRSAGLSRAVAGLAPGVATAVLCALALAVGGAHQVFSGHVAAARPRPASSAPRRTVPRRVRCPTHAGAHHTTARARVHARARPCRSRTPVTRP